LARSQWNIDSYALYQATAMSMRDRLIEYWNDTQEHFSDMKVKRMYYMSIEYLMGRYLRNAIMNTGLRGQYIEALNNLGMRLEDVYDEEIDAALGSGGLGRLAACFLDSLATLNYPAWGYGLRYEFGMFKQNIVGGQQAEVPEYWLERGNPWEICRRDMSYTIMFGGSVTPVRNASGSIRHKWEGSNVVIAMAYDTPVPGYGTPNTLNLRLWSAQPATVFDLEQFNREDQHPDYWSTLNQRQKDENITKVSILSPLVLCAFLHISLDVGVQFSCTDFFLSRAGPLSQDHAKGARSAPEAAVLLLLCHAAGHSAQVPPD
jgi:starch phosphorylase